VLPHEIQTVDDGVDVGMQVLAGVRLSVRRPLIGQALEFFHGEVRRGCDVFNRKPAERKGAQYEVVIPW
jgi:hypothetical protein